MATIHRSQIDFSLFKNSVELDADLLINLTRILMRPMCLSWVSDNGSQNNKSMPSFNDYLSKSTTCSLVIDESDGCLKKENARLKQSVKELGSYLELINNERKQFRSLIVDMLKQRFWKILADDRFLRFFHAKMGGINAEILARRSAILEKELEKMQKVISQKDAELRKARTENVELTKKLDRSNTELKKLILEDARNKTETLESNSNSNALTNSFTVDPPQRSATIASDTKIDNFSYFKSQNSPKRIEKFPYNKEMQAKIEVLRSKNSSVRQHRMSKATLQCCHYEYVEPNLESTQVIYQIKPKLSESVRRKR